MNYERKALDLARENNGVSPVLLMMKLKIRFPEAEILAKITNERYLKCQENKKRTRFQTAHKAPSKSKYRKMTKITVN